MKRLSTTEVATRSSTLRQAIVLAAILSVSLVAEVQSASPASRLQTTAGSQKKVSTTAVSYYTCPMHSDVKTAKRGKCPKCGMALRLERIDTTGPGNSVLTSSSQISRSATTDNVADPDLGFSSSRSMVIPDVAVLDQEGRTVHFYSDLIKGRTVVINFIFTTCTTICPPLAATFARVQREMGDKVGRDVHFISISVDPLTDTPERLKAWGEKFKAGPGWTFVTGNKQEIAQLLNALGASVARREDHSPTIIVGNDLKDVWKRTYGLAKTSQLVELILNVMDGTAPDAVTKDLGKP